ncbi:hypothetical protein Bhyg_11092, partial [Pseudolycoriella hygida]
MRQLFIFSIIF